MNSKNESHLIPKMAMLDQFTNFFNVTKGIYLQDIPENALIEVQAIDIILTIAIINKEDAMVAVRGNVNFFTAPEICRLEGSTLGGSFIKMRWLEAGFNLELHRLSEPVISPSEPVFNPTRRLTISTVQSIIIWNDPDNALALCIEALKNSPRRTMS